MKQRKTQPKTRFHFANAPAETSVVVVALGTVVAASRRRTTVLPRTVIVDWAATQYETCPNDVVVDNDGDVACSVSMAFPHHSVAVSSVATHHRAPADDEWPCFQYAD